MMYSIPTDELETVPFPDRVWAAVQVLDEFYGSIDSRRGTIRNWPYEIDLDQLDMTCSEDCIGGQLSGATHEELLDEVEEQLGVEARFRLNFALDIGFNRNSRDAQPGSPQWHAQMAQLDMAWRIFLDAA